MRGMIVPSERWRVATIGEWEMTGTHLPQKEQKDNLFLVCKELYKLFSTTSSGNKNQLFYVFSLQIKYTYKNNPKYMAVALAGQLREGTKKSHTMAENTGFVACFLKGCLLYTSPSPRDDR